MSEQVSFNTQIIDNGSEIRPEASVVVVDVIRSFTCAAIALAQGADNIFCVTELEQARNLKKDNPEYVLIGEERGIKPEDFDFGNSPEEYFLTNFSGKQLVQRSTNGTRGLIEAASACRLLVASAVNASATARALIGFGEPTVDLVVTDSSTSEDRACAEFIIDSIHGNNVDKNELQNTILGAEEEHKVLWRRIRTDQELLEFNRDVKNCADVDKYDFAIVANNLTNRAVSLQSSRGSKK